MNTISFPNMFDINNSKLNTNLSYNYKSIHESLTSLLLTSPGELLGDPAYGCGAKEKLFDVKSDVNTNELRSLIITAINKYIPQIIVNQSDIKFYYTSNDNKYKIVIRYRVNYDSTIETYELVL